MVDFKFKSIFLQTLMETLFNEAVKRMVKLLRTGLMNCIIEN